MNRENWVSKLHDYVDEEGYEAISKLIKDIENKSFDDGYEQGMKDG